MYDIIWQVEQAAAAVTEQKRAAARSAVQWQASAQSLGYGGVPAVSTKARSLGCLVCLQQQMYGCRRHCVIHSISITARCPADIAWQGTVLIACANQDPALSCCSCSTQHSGAMW